jgi:hypothetical protein
VREPTTRSNPYFSPGELSNLARGLYAATCANTGDSAQVPIRLGNVPCRVQPKLHWGNGIPDSYYPHLTRAPKP